MTENEIKEATLEDALYCAKALAGLEVCEECRFYKLCHVWCDDVHGLIVDALEEIQQYRAIGTVDEVAEMSNSYINYFHKVRKYQAIGTIEEFKALKEKNEPKIGLSRGQGHESYLVCPNCNSHMKDDQELFDLDGEIIQCKKCKQLVIVDWQ